MKILFFSTQPYDVKSFNALSHTHEIEYVSCSLTLETVSLAKGFDAICLFVNDHVDEKIAASLMSVGVKYIALRSAGFNHINLEATKHYNLKVVRVPAYSPSSVAEHTAALLLALNRKTHKAYNRVREGNFSLVGLEGFTIKGKTVGIIGFGKIGKAFADICLGFGAQVIASDPCYNQTYKNIPNISVNELYRCSDIISLHCPLTETTKHIINEDSLSHMQDGVVILNTGRGALIDTKSLIQSLKKRKVGAVGLDVYEQEEAVFFGDHSLEIIEDDLLMRLMTFPNVLITSHQGFFTREALHEIAVTTLNNLTYLEQFQRCPNEVS